MSDSRPIGVFDSGVGGLTVARAILDLLPHEPLVYVGDTARFPYGSKPLGEIRRHARAVAPNLVPPGAELWRREDRPGAHREEGGVRAGGRRRSRTRDAVLTGVPCAGGPRRVGR